MRPSAFKMMAHVLPDAGHAADCRSLKQPGDSSHGCHSRGALTLFELPSDLLDLILTPFRRHLPVSAAINLAYTCKLAASLVLPRLYSSAPLWSLHTLPDLYSTVSTRKDLADHIRALLASEAVAFASEQFDRVSGALASSKLSPGSAIASIDAALARCGPEALQALPMMWLARIAEACPNLVSVDLTMWSVPNTPPCVMFGFLRLAQILRERRGKFKSPSRSLALAIVLVDEPMNEQEQSSAAYQLRPMVAAYPRSVPYCVLGMDWGRKELTVAEGPMDKAESMFMAPLCDLVSKDREEQATWRIKNVNSCSVDAGIGGEKRRPGPIVESTQDAWSRFGVRMDEDHVFTLDQSRGRGPCDVGVWAMSLEAISEWMTSHGMDASKSCSSASIRGFDISKVASLDSDEAQSQITSTLSSIQRMPAQPWTALDSFTFTFGIFLNAQNIQPTLTALAVGAPNLVALRIHNIIMPLDICLPALDVLIRRPTKPLIALSVLCRFGPRFSGTINTAPSLFETSPTRSSLSQTRATALHLKMLSIKCVSNGPNGLSRSYPRVLIHPGLLHGIVDLSLAGVQIAISPPELAHPTSPSFVPAGALDLHSSIALQLGFATLPLLRVLEISSTCFQHAYFNPAASLPGAPKLRRLRYSDSPMTEALSVTDLIRLLTRYPQLRTARVAKAHLTRADIEQIVIPRLVGAHPRELRPCPLLKELFIRNLAHSSDGHVAGRVVLGLHVFDLVAEAQAAANQLALIKSSAEKEQVPGSQSVLQKGEDLCTECGLIAPPHDPNVDFEASAGVKETMLRVGLPVAKGRAIPMVPVRDVSIEERCVRCGQEKIVKLFGRHGSNKGELAVSRLRKEPMFMWLN